MMHDVISQLEHLRRRGWLMLLLQRCSVVCAAAIGVTIVLVLLDYALRLPATMRVILLAAGLATLGFATWRFIFPVARFRPTLMQLALRVERVLPALAGRLASSIEFAVSGVAQTNALAARSVRETQARLAGESVGNMIEPRQTIRGVVVLAFAVLVASFIVFANPAAAQTGLTRLFAPFSEAKWPARTGVVSLMSEVIGDRGVHPRGQTLPLRAKVTRGDVAQRVDARFRIKAEGQLQPWQHVVLTQQGSSSVHERLIDTSGNVESIEAYFSTQDDRTAAERIAIVTPPAVRRASLTVTPPAYAADVITVYETELGPGTDSRAQTGSPILIGSHVRLDLHLNKPMPTPADVRGLLGWDDESAPPRFMADEGYPTQWTLEWTLDQSRTLRLNLVDEYGLTSAESIAYRIDAVADREPVVTITQPQADEAVLATAIVRLAGEAQDDVGLTRLALLGHLRSGADLLSSDIPLWTEEVAPGQARTARISADLDLATLELSEGDVLYITAVAQDLFAIDGEQRQPTISAPRRLRIISEVELETYIRQQLRSVRQNAIRMEAIQHELQEGVVDRESDTSGERAQAQLSERIAAQREEVDRIERMLQDNRMSETSLESLLRQSADLLDFAGTASSRAVEALAERESLGHTPERERNIIEHQQEVREELSDLIELLDRDEDTWVMTRQLEGLMREQSELQEATNLMGERTMGRSLSELTPGESSELDRIAQTQRELRDRAREMIDELRRRADQLESVDPQAAAGMRDAARTAEQRELDRDMGQAADRAEQNQMRNAQQSQQAAAATLQRMLEDVEQTQRVRAEQLLRQLASLLESIERLIVVQENELIALANARHRESFSGRDRAMIRLNQNTQAVAGEARMIGQQTRRIARTLDRAADAQGTAITALRGMPIRVDEAEDAETRSLELLREAKELAEELEQQTQEAEAQRQREELLEAYRSFAQRQVVLHEQTQMLQQHEVLDRRQVVEARRIGSQQEQIRTGLLDLQRATQEILDSLIFSHVHARIDGWSRRVSESLDAGDVGERVTSHQFLIAESIGQLIQALEDMPPTPEEFDEGEEGGMGGEGGGTPPLIAPIAELRLLRGMQEQVYNQTQVLDAMQDVHDETRRELLREIGSQQRELIEISRQMMEQFQQSPANASP